MAKKKRQPEDGFNLAPSAQSSANLDNDIPKKFRFMLQQAKKQKTDGVKRRKDDSSSLPRIRPDESFREFNERVNHLSNNEIQKAIVKQEKFGEKRKEKIKQRNQLVRQKKQEKRKDRMLDLAEKKYFAGQTESAYAAPKFGEVAQAPPVNIKPPKEVFKTREHSMHQQRLMTAERQRVIDAYRKMKSAKSQ